VFRALQIPVILILLIIPVAGYSQHQLIDVSHALQSFEPFPGETSFLSDHSRSSLDWLASTASSSVNDNTGLIVRGQEDGGAGEADSNDPSAPLVQLRFQNAFIPETIDSSGYSNQFIFQGIFPLHISEDSFFPFHVLRPTVPIIAPSPDPDGPLGVQGGLGDTTVLDVFIRPAPELKTSFGFGYVAVLPTSTHPQLGLGEWEFGPTILMTTTAVDKWLFGAVYYHPFSMQSDSYQGFFQPIVVRNFPNHWFAGWGEEVWKVTDENGQYDLPINLRVGKVVEVGRHKLNVFLQGKYTPNGLHSGTSGSTWGVKINVAFLLPEAKLYAPLLHHVVAH
jgi:hypothetical protein